MLLVHHLVGADCSSGQQSPASGCLQLTAGGAWHHGKAGRGPRLWGSLQEAHQLRRRMMTVAIYLGGYQCRPSLCLPDWAAAEMQICGY